MLVEILMKRRRGETFVTIAAEVDESRSFDRSRSLFDHDIFIRGKVRWSEAETIQSASQEWIQTQ